MGYKAQWNSLGLTTVARFAFTGSEATRHGEAQHPFCDDASVEDGCGRRLLIALVINLQPFSNMAGLGPLRSGALRSDIGYAAEAGTLVSRRWIALCGDDRVHATATL
jgi:hypothetical protein